MIAKEIAARRTGGSFRGLVSYLTSSHGKAERVGQVHLTNCFSTDVPSAVLEVQNAQARNRGARNTTYHLLLSFREQLSPEVLKVIERRACDALGFGDHHRVSVVHHDTDHLHVHVAINRVHPVTHRVHWPSYSKLALDRLCIELEREHGLQVDRHATQQREGHLQALDAERARLQRECAAALSGASSWSEFTDVAQAHGVRVGLRGNSLVFSSPNGTLVRASSVAPELALRALERRFGSFSAEGDAAIANQHRVGATRAPHMEHVSGCESLVGWIRRGCARELLQAATWIDLHRVAGANGLDVKLRGNGLVFVSSDGLGVKASSITRELSKGQLEKRLGAFEPSAVTPPSGRSQYEKRPLERNDRASALYARYQYQRTAAAHGRTAAIEQLRAQFEADQERVAQASRRRWAAVRFVAKGSVGWVLWRAYARRADRTARARMYQKHRAASRAVTAGHQRLVWLDWLRAEAANGDDQALEALRHRKVPAPPAASNSVIGEHASARSPRIRPDHVTSAGVVVYSTPDAAIRDDGKRLHLRGARGTERAADALLRLAHARFGAEIGVDGDEEFRDSLVRAAVRTQLPIAFVDAALEQRRLNHQKEHDDVGDRSRPGQRADAARIHRAAEWGRAERERGRGRREPDVGIARYQAPPRPDAGLRSVSALDVVRLGRPLAVLLPDDARRHMEQRGAGTHHSVRRDRVAGMKRGRQRRAKP